MRPQREGAGEKSGGRSEDTRAPSTTPVPQGRGGAEPWAQPRGHAAWEPGVQAVTNSRMQVPLLCAAPTWGPSLGTQQDPAPTCTPIQELPTRRLMLELCGILTAPHEGCETRGKWRSGFQPRPRHGHPPRPHA